MGYKIGLILSFLLGAFAGQLLMYEHFCPRQNQLEYCK